MKSNAANWGKNTKFSRISHAAVPGAGLALAAFISYETTSRILTSRFISRDDQLLGGMWSVIATLFVIRHGWQQSISAALSRTAATLLSFVLCLAYLLVLPFSSWGMAILIGIGSAILIVFRRPQDIITTTITTAVVMVVAGISPQHAWRQPILRLFDTLIGVAIGIAALSVGLRLSHHNGSANSMPPKENSQWQITKNTL